MQLFGNVSRSFEPPSFGELTGGAAVIDSLRAQRATTWEVGGRGSFGWGAVDLALYRAKVTDELLAYSLNLGGAQVVPVADPQVPLLQLNVAEPVVGCELSVAVVLEPELVLDTEAVQVFGPTDQDNVVAAHEAGVGVVELWQW